jgi:SAM-dependent methyltransferase
MHATARKAAISLVAVVASAWILAAQQRGVPPVSGRVFAQPMGVQGAPWLERDERQQEEEPDRALRILKIPKGAVVADIGAGSGYMSVRMAKIVGPEGKVYANDIQLAMLDLLRKNVEKAKLTNVTPVLGTTDDPRLPAGAIDLALMVDVYHELEYPYEMLASITRALKPGGRLVFVEFKGNDPTVPIKPLHTLTEAQVRKEAAVQPLEWEKTVSNLPWQHVIVFRKR